MMQHVKALFSDGEYFTAWWFPSTRTVNVLYSDQPDVVESFDIMGFSDLMDWVLMGGSVDVAVRL